MNLIIIVSLIFTILLYVVYGKNELEVIKNNKKEIKKASHVMLDIDLDNIIDINNKQTNNQQLYIKVLNNYNIIICENKINLKYKKLQCNIPSQYINEGNNILYITIYNPITMEVLGSLDASFIVEYDITNDNIIPKEFSVYKTSNNHNHMNLLSSQYYNTLINQDNIKKYVIGFIIFSGFIFVYYLLPNSDQTSGTAVPIIDSAPAPNPFDYPSNDSGTSGDGSYPYTPPIPSLPVYTNPATTTGTDAGTVWGPNPNKVTNYGIGMLAAGTGIFLLGQTVGGNRPSDAYIGRNRRRGGGLYDRYNYINTLPSPTLTTTTKSGTLSSTYDGPYTLPTPQVTHISNGNTSILRTITNIIWVTIYKTFQDRPF